MDNLLKCHTYALADRIHDCWHMHRFFVGGPPLREAPHFLRMTALGKQVLARQLLHRVAKHSRVMINIRAIGLRRHQCHVVKRSQQNSPIHGVQV
jgi:hypothetical protein